MKKKQKWLVILTITGMLLAACASNKSTDTTENQARPVKQEIKVASGGGAFDFRQRSLYGCL